MQRLHEGMLQKSSCIKRLARVRLRVCATFTKHPLASLVCYGKGLCAQMCMYVRAWVGSPCVNFRCSERRCSRNLIFLRVLNCFPCIPECFPAACENAGINGCESTKRWKQQKMSPAKTSPTQPARVRRRDQMTCALGVACSAIVRWFSLLPQSQVYAM